MAIYHLEAKVISRGVGRSAVAASAYMSCSKIFNDYDGVQHDYTKKQGLVYEQVLLPPQAPPEWKDRGVLWNAVEESEKSKDIRLAREFVIALPVELSKEQDISLLTEYVKDNFVADGMCADFCIHDTDGHNPHAHILLTVRPQVEYDTEAELYEIYGASFSRGIFNTAKSEIDNSIDGAEIYSICRQLENYKQQQNEQKHEKHRSSHDEDELEL